MIRRYKHKKYDYIIIHYKIMFITTVKMLEPTTASFAIYLLSKTTTLKRNIIQKRPLHYKKKICKWMLKNKHTIIDIGVDEIADVLFDLSNNIHVVYNPSLAVILYTALLIIFICL